MQQPNVTLERYCGFQWCAAALPTTATAVPALHQHRCRCPLLCTPCLLHATVHQQHKRRSTPTYMRLHALQNWIQECQRAHTSHFIVQTSQGGTHFQGWVAQKSCQLGQCPLQHRLCVRVVYEQGQPLQHGHPHARPGHVVRQVTWNKEMMAEVVAQLIGLFLAGGNCSVS